MSLSNICDFYKIASENKHEKWEGKLGRQSDAILCGPHPILETYAVFFNLIRFIRPDQIFVIF